jgi:hypothetical protein
VGDRKGKHRNGSRNEGKRRIGRENDKNGERTERMKEKEIKEWDRNTKLRKRKSKNKQIRRNSYPTLRRSYKSHS